jgi:hypothetical protein
VTDAKGERDPTLVERWLQEQQEWQRTLLAYVDSMVKKDDFLVNLGNAMRGSLLAGKPYPTATATAPSQTDERLDKVLFALNTLQGQLQDLFMSIEDIRKALAPAPPTPTPEPTARSRPPARRSVSSRTRKARG